MIVMKTYNRDLGVGTIATTHTMVIIAARVAVDDYELLGCCVSEPDLPGGSLCNTSTAF